jgi:F-type H+-transporting ATPase subunit gamma
MKMVAAAKLRRAQQQIVAARPYAYTLRRVLAGLLQRTEHSHPLLEARPVERAWLVVVTSDKGLCGSFNTNIVREAERLLRAETWPEVELVTIGRKACDYFKRRQWPIAHSEPTLMSSLGVEDGHVLAEMFMKAFTTAQVDAVVVLYSSFVSMLRQEVTREDLLPLTADDAELQEAAEPAVDYLYEPGPGELLEILLPRHVKVQMQRILFDSAAAEQAARMTAMEAATKNASEMIDDLTLLYNRTRQAAITKELIEIVSGAEAQ